MAYRLKDKDSSVEKAVRRIACQQIDKALGSIERLEPALAIHDVRKRCKKLRGLIRLVRPAFAAYSDENAAFRDIARLISGARDAKVMQDTYDLLMDRYSGQIDRRALGSIRRRFTYERKDTGNPEDVSASLDQARQQLASARDRAAAWELSEKGWQAVSGGLEKTYGRARKAAAEARPCPNGEVFHDLRKRIKYHWYHCRLLVPLWPEMLAVRNDLAKELSDLLGDHHDLTVFTEKLSGDPDAYGNAGDVETAVGLARARQSALEEQAWPMADRLFAQAPEDLARHFEALWLVWREKDALAA